MHSTSPMDSFSDFVERLYQRDDDFDPAITQPVTFRVRVDHLHMLQALSERFSESRSRLGADLLEQAILQVFSLLDVSDQEVLATKADDAFRASCNVFVGLGHWAACLEVLKGGASRNEGTHL